MVSQVFRRNRVRGGEMEWDGVVCGVWCGVWSGVEWCPSPLLRPPPIALPFPHHTTGGREREEGGTREEFGGKVRTREGQQGGKQGRGEAGGKRGKRMEEEGREGPFFALRTFSLFAHHAAVVLHVSLHATLMFFFLVSLCLLLFPGDQFFKLVFAPFQLFSPLHLFLLCTFFGFFFSGLCEIPLMCSS